MPFQSPEPVMGTSSKYPGPSGGQWANANRRLGIWMSNLDRKAAADADEVLVRKANHTTRELADLYRSALAADLGNDPAAFGVRETFQAAGARLVGALESLRAGAAGWVAFDGGSAQAREEAFICGFAGQVAGSGAMVTDTAVRQAAVACAQELLNKPGPLQEAVQEGKPIRGGSISDELFCLVFQLFFKDALARFVTTIVAGKIRLAFPLLHIIDPAGKIASWAGQQVAAMIPDPCAQGQGLADKPSIADLANGLITESVDRVLGLPVTVQGSAAA
jgi:hypothetical protein